jgi:hypothetical protein
MLLFLMKALWALETRSFIKGLKRKASTLAMILAIACIEEHDRETIWPGLVRSYGFLLTTTLSWLKVIDIPSFSLTETLIFWGHMSSTWENTLSSPFDSIRSI